MRVIAKTIWDLSEFLGINLGRLGPYILGLMMASKPNKVNKKNK